MHFRSFRCYKSPSYLINVGILSDVEVRSVTFSKFSALNAFIQAFWSIAPNGAAPPKLGIRGPSPIGVGNVIEVVPKEPNVKV